MALAGSADAFSGEEEDMEEEEGSDEHASEHAGNGLASQNGNGESDASPPAGKKAKRLCRHPGCKRVIKSQGHCQRHGAKAKRCKVDGCDKQAQGTVS
jgi:hypothetical protein